MSQLTVNTPRVYSEVTETDWNDLPADAVNLYVGSAASYNAANGCIRQLVAADNFAGFVEHETDNVSPQTTATQQASAFNGATPGTGVAGGTNVNLRVQGAVVLNVTTDGSTLVASQLDVTGAKIVYASDGNTFTYNVTSNTKIGCIIGFIGVVSGTAGQNGCVAQYLVQFNAAPIRNS